MDNSKLPIFYWNSSRHEGVDGANPEEAHVTDALKIFHSLYYPDSFFGVCLPNGMILQLIFGDDLLFHVQYLREGSDTALTCSVNVPLAEIVLRAAFAGKDVAQSLSGYPVDWTRENLYK